MLHFASSASLARQKLRSTPFKREATLIFVVLFFYCLNRFFGLFSAILPHDFALYHLNDLFGGIVFPSYVNAILILSKYRVRVRTISKILAIELVCAFVWEGLAPLFLPWSTGDILDVACYLFGGVLYFSFCQTIAQASKSQSIVSKKQIYPEEHREH